MKLSSVVRVSIVLAITSLVLAACPPCTTQQVEVPFVFEQTGTGRLHVFQTQKHRLDSGIPIDAKVHVIETNSKDSIVETRVSLPAKTVELQALDVQLEYEYHADGKSLPTSLEFAIMDLSDNELWSQVGLFTPEQLKVPGQTGELHATFALHFPEGVTQIKVKVIPKSPGEFGFYVSSLQGTLRVCARQP